MQPPMLPHPASITDDDDSHEEPIPRYAVPNEGKEDVDPRALAYLLRYETMVRQQEAEDMATLAHIRPLLERIQHLGSHPDDDKYSFADAPRLMERQVSYKVLERALAVLEASSEVMTTDKQLMMVLRTLTAKVPTAEETITWAEFLQCYKTVIVGMQTLSHLPGASIVRSRARDRTLSSLSLFEPPSTKLLAEGISIESVVVNKKSFKGTSKQQELKRGVGKQISVRVALGVAIVLSAFVLGAFCALPVRQRVLGRHVKSSPVGTRAAETPDGSKLNTMSTLTSTVRSPKSDSDSLGSASLQEEQHVVTLKRKPAIGKILKQGMVSSALVGGVVGFVLAPTVVGVFQVAVPKLVAVMASVKSSIVASRVAVLLSALTVGSTAASGNVRKSFGSFLSHLMTVLRISKEDSI